jgi:glycosyltransferase involved in cell wall biosynthesis
MIRVAIFISEVKEKGSDQTASDLSFYLAKEYQCFVLVDGQASADFSNGGELINIVTKNPLKKLYQLKQFKKENAIAATISFTIWPNLLNIFTRTNDKIIISVREPLPIGRFGIRKEIEHFLKKQYYKKVDLIVVPLHGIKQELIEEYHLKKEKVKVIYNPIDTEKIRTLAEEKIEKSYRDFFAHPVVVNVGELTREKGQRQLIKAFTKVKEEFPGAKLLLLGDGYLKEYLQQLVADLELENDVIFHTSNNPYKYLARATVAVFPSLYEDYPHELSEAMVCGVPVIATDCRGGHREFLAPDTLAGGPKEISGIEEAKYGTLIPVCEGGISNYVENLTEGEHIIAKSIIRVIKGKEAYQKRADRAAARMKAFSKVSIMEQWSELL